MSIPGAPSASTCRQETEEQHRSGRPEAVRPEPGAVSTAAPLPCLCRNPSGASAGGACAAALAFGRLPLEVPEQGLVSVSVSAGRCHNSGEAPEAKEPATWAGC